MKTKTVLSQDLRKSATNLYICVMLLLFPLFTGPFGYAEITLSKYLFFVCCTGIWAVFLIAVSIARKYPLPQVQGCHAAALGFGAACLLSWGLSPWRGESLIGAGRYDGLVTQLLYVCIFVGVSLFGRLQKQHFICIGVSAALCAAVSAAQLFGWDLFGLFPGDFCYYDSGIRYSGAFLGTMGNTNVLSAFFCFALPILASLPIVKDERGAWKALLPVCVMVFVLVRTGVAGGFVGFGAAALVALPVLMSDLGRVRRGLLVAAAAAASAAAALAFAPTYSLQQGLALAFRFNKAAILCAALALIFAAAAKSIRTSWEISGKKLRWASAALSAAIVLGALAFVWMSPAEEGTIYELSQVMHGHIADEFGSSRVRIWRECLALFGERPILGSGPDTVALRLQVDFSRFVEETGITLSSSVDNAHNEYLGYLLNTGILGLAAYLILLGGTAVKWLRSLGSANVCVLGLGVLCYCVQSFFALGLPLVAPLLWIGLGLIYAREFCEETEKPERRKKSRRK